MRTAVYVPLLGAVLVTAGAVVVRLLRESCLETRELARDRIPRPDLKEPALPDRLRAQGL